MQNTYDTVTFKEIFDYLHSSARHMTEQTQQFTGTDHKKLIHKLCFVCESLGSDKPARPISVPLEYKQHWEEFISGTRRSLDRRALRYLCWEPDIAVTPRFVDYIINQQMETSHRAIQGLVRACHRRWAVIMNYTVPDREKLFDRIRDIVKKYQGTNKIVCKWIFNLDAVLSAKAHDLYGGKLLDEKKAIKEYVEDWGLDLESEFVRCAVESAVVNCKSRIYSESEKCDYLFDNLLSWNEWILGSFKRYVTSLILDEQMLHYNSVRDRLQKFILSDDRLGDPRLPRNQRNWYDISRDANDRFIQWLSQADIVFFFEHVLPQGRDPHGRKAFWLRYVKNLRASRPMLCSEDEARLKPILLKEKDLVGHFGKICTSNSVFLLDFGSIVVVEFSRVGACYVYDSGTFKKIFPDLWSKHSFKESKFKDRSKYIYRRVHIGRWQYEMSNLLARYGIRPS